MKFQLSTVGDKYHLEDAEKLKTLGFEFTVAKFNRAVMIKTDKEVTIELNTIAELVAFTNEWNDIVVSGDSIQIYDDYRE